MKKRQKILVLVGPTSSGKSALGVALARKFNGEVISADSRQVYRGLNIGTGKITKREMKGVRHHLLDEVRPHRIFTAHDFVERGRKAIEEISGYGKLPIIVGGTGFYIDALVGRITLPNVPPNPALRATLAKKNAELLFALLKKEDPQRAETIDPHNKRRLIRALEIAAALGRVHHHIDLRNRYSVLWIGLITPKRELDEKIHIRLIARMRAGMVAEARELHKGGLSYKRMEQLGLEYRALARYLQEKITRADMLAELERDIGRYAKRQLTYWRRNRSIRWFDPSEKQKMLKVVAEFVSGR